MLPSPHSILAFSGYPTDVMLMLAMESLIIAFVFSSKWFRQVMQEFKDGLDNGKGPPNLPPPSGSIATAQGPKSARAKSPRRFAPPPFFRRFPQKRNATADSFNSQREPNDSFPG
jgi:hypothetical protein